MVAVWDATAKPAAGLLSGNSNQLGDYDSCLAVELSALGAVQSKYCLADIDLETSGEALPSVRVAVNRLQAGAFVRSKHSDVSLLMTQHLHTVGSIVGQGQG